VLAARAALKSGRSHHTVNMAFITEMATGLPGATGQIPNATAPLAEMLRPNGYATAAQMAFAPGPTIC
jgi:arylsulfatase